MARATRSAAAAASPKPARTAAIVKKEKTAASVKKESPAKVKQEPKSQVKPSRTPRKRQSSVSEETPKKKAKLEDEDTGLPSPSTSDEASPPPSSKKTKSLKSKVSKEAGLQAKKLKAYTSHSGQSPFPDFPHPTAAEAKLAHKILAQLHGERTRPEKVVANNDRAGCGDSPLVLDALIRTILSQNTSDTNSTRAKRSMDDVYGGVDKYDEIVAGGQAKLQEAIKSGGLSVVKSKVIISILQQAKEKYGSYTLDHLFEKSNDEAMQELISFQGVGPKTASCVLLFCLQRESFAVDTHVHRITGLLGWRPKSANREDTHSHLDARIPDEDKYGLHILLVGHGKKCDECKAGGKNLGKCELRKAFRKGKLEGEAGEGVKKEEEKEVKVEDE